MTLCGAVHGQEFELPCMLVKNRQERAEEGGRHNNMSHYKHCGARGIATAKEMNNTADLSGVIE